jgi:hypothetical protein
MNRKLRDIYVLVALSLALVWSLPAIGQVVKGSISGTVTDPQGAVVSGAQVKATNTQTGAVLTTTSDSSGLFRFNLIQAGSYKVEVTAQGFQTSVQNNVGVVAGADTGLGAVKLPVGETSTTVEVTADTPLIETTQSQITNTFSGVQLQSFAGVQENEGLDRLALFVPGVAATRDASFTNTNGVGFGSNGNRGRDNDQEIDGQNNNDNSIGGPSLFVSDPNFVQQYVIITNNFGPEYGRNAGSVVNIITKSGTNNWHGSGYGDEGNSFLNALSNTQKNVTKNPVTGAPGLSGPPRANNEFGGFTIGGPIAKNKIFYFGGFDEQIISQQSAFSTGLATPTPLGLTQLAACPGVDPSALSALQRFGPFGISAGNPTPVNPRNATVAGCTIQVGGVSRIVPAPSHAFNFVQRADMNLGGDSISGRYIFNRNNVFNRNDNGAAGWLFNQSALSQATLLSWTHNFSSRMVNELRVGFDRLNVGFGGNNIGNAFEPTASNLDNALTNVSFSNATLGFGPATNLPELRIVNTWQAQDNWNYVLGRHQLKAGVNWTYERSPNIFLPTVNGAFTFSNLTNFVLNKPSLVAFAQGPEALDFREYDTFAYAGDDWKIAQNLTLNLGITWTYYGNPESLLHDLSVARESNPATAFWPTANPTTGQPIPLNDRTVPTVSNVYSSFGPSIGFAYSPQWGGFLTGQGKTVIRGGVRLSYNPPYYNLYSDVGTSAPFVFSQTLSGANALATPLPAVPTGANVRAEIAPFVQHGAFDPRTFANIVLPTNFQPEKTESWSLGVEREVTKNSAIEARYIGNHAYRLFNIANGNPFIADLQRDFPSAVPAGLTPCPAGQAFDPIAVGRVNCNEGLQGVFGNGGFSRYDALQVQFRTNNLFHQLFLTTGYTWSKTLDNTTDVFATLRGGNTSDIAQNPANPGRPEYSISGLNTPNVWTVNFVEQLPFFKEQHGLVGHVLGGWSIAGDYILASGQPYTPVQLGAEALSSAAGDYYDANFLANFLGFDSARPFLGNANAPATAVGVFAGDAGVTSVAPTQLISLNALNASGNVVNVTNKDVRYILNASTAQTVFGTPFGTAPRNLSSDAMQNVANVSVIKSIKLGERASFEFRATALNAFNHFNFQTIDPAIEDAGFGPNSTPSFAPGSGVGFGLPSQTAATGRTVFVGGRISF